MIIFYGSLHRYMYVIRKHRKIACSFRDSRAYCNDVCRYSRIKSENAIVYFVLFHRRTRIAYLYNACLAWCNVVLTARITQA